MAKEALYYLYRDGEFFVRAVGHITAALCPDLKSQMQSVLLNGGFLKAVRVDLSACDYMDSTFMGLLLSFHKTLKEHSGLPLEVIDPSEDSLQLLKNLGISRLMSINEGSYDFPENMTLATREKIPSPEFLLDTHQELMKVSDENRSKFALLEKVLKDQIQKG